MQLQQVRVRNFRALEDITLTFNERVAVIVGPNAIGKTTVLEAIRLAKALLAPRTGSEPNQVLMALGGLFSGAPSMLNPAAIARDPAQAVRIDSTYALSADEIGR